MQSSTLAKRLFLLLFVLVTGFYLYGIGFLPLIGPDEPRYAQVAREMFRRGDFVTPTLAGHTWFEKPPLLYWMMIVAYRFFGVGEFAVRIGPALSGLLTSFAVWMLSRKFEKAHPEKLRGFSFWSTTVVATSLGMIVFTRGATFDIIVTMAITFALVFYLLHELERTSQRSGRLLLVGFYAFIGLSLLAKGLVGIVIPVGVVALYHLLARKKPSRDLLISLLWGLPVTVLVAAVWYGPVIYQHGWAFVDEFFIQHHFARYTSNKYEHRQRIYFYIPILLMLTVPWTALLIDSLVHFRVSKNTPLIRIFALCWLVFPLLFFSFSGSKLPGYLLPVLPAAAILIAERLTKSHSRWPNLATGMITISLALGSIIYSIASGLPPLGITILVTFPFLASGLLVILLGRTANFTVLAVAFGVLISLTGILTFAAAGLADKQSVRRLLAIANDRGFGSTPIFIRRGSDRTAEFYAEGRVVYGPDGEPQRLEDSSEIVAEARRRGETILVLVPVEYLAEYRASPYFEIIADNGELAILATRVHLINSNRD